MYKDPPIAQVIVGRAPGVDILIDAPMISRQHAIFEMYADGTVKVSDMGAQNGVSLDGQRVEQAVVMPHNRVALGSYEINMHQVHQALIRKQMAGEHHPPGIDHAPAPEPSPSMVSEPTPPQRAAIPKWLIAGLISGGLIIVTLVVLIMNRDSESSETKPKKAPEAELKNQPSAPGAKGKTTLAGIDADGDGIRDDVQRFIAAKYRSSQRTRAALSQLAGALLAMIQNANNRVQVKKYADAVIRAMECLSYVNPDGARKASAMIQSVVCNTKPRSVEYVRALAYIGGTLYPSQPMKTRKQSCIADVENMPN